ncbi:MAG: nucleotide pyrophosphohydrolase [bacterium]|nr:nucleotide pyrophosphohydrolase [bacterium]
MISDKNTCLHELKDKIKEFVKEREWERYHHPKELAISMSIEIAELLEIFQWEEKECLGLLENNQQKMERIREELADVIMYALSISNQLNIDLSQAIIKKLEANKIKYPSEKVLKEGLYKKKTY